MKHLSKPILIHICKDRTLSYRRRGQPIFNGVALPVFSVANEAEADALFTLIGTTQYEPHPDQNFKHKYWRKLYNGIAGWSQHLELQDLNEITEYMAESYKLLRASMKGE